MGEAVVRGVMKGKREWGLGLEREDKFYSFIKKVCK